MKNKFWFFVFLLIIGGCSHKEKPSSIKEISVEEQPAYFVSVPITKLSSTQCPCIDVMIDDAIFSMGLDLGFSGHLSLNPSYIDQIASKTFLCTDFHYGIKGKKYPNNLFSIPKVDIGLMSLKELILEEESLEFKRDAVSVENGKEPSPRIEHGMLGWQLFYHVNLLVDIKNSRIAFCDSLETLKREGYATETFVQTSLHLDREMLEIEAKTPDRGILRCLLDTGCTFNMLHSETAKGGTIEKAIWEPENILEFPSFQINEHDFGTIEFRQVPINTPVPIDAILGMDFFSDHLVFLDLSGGYAYFQKNTD